MSFKYVMFELHLSNTDLVQMVPVIFPAQVTHSDLAERLEVMFASQGYKVTLHSAGFLYLGCSGVYGKSETLDLKADEHDKDVINSFPYISGFV
jgi:hypothetical protein